MGGGVGGAAVGLIEYEAAGVVAGLEDIKAQVPALSDRGLMVDPRRLKKIIDMPGFDMNMNQCDVHGEILNLY